MYMSFKRIFSLMLICLVVLVTLAGCKNSANRASTSYKEDYLELSTGQGEETSGLTSEQEYETSEPTLDPDGSYSSKEDVSRYLVEYGRLPNNFITKKTIRNISIN